MGLRDIGESLPPGFRFYPSDEELVCHYLYKKIAKEEVLRGTLVEIDLHICEPWQLPEMAKLNSNEWYFFSFRDRKYATGFRTNRATTTGYWKATGKDRVVLDPTTRGVVGMRKTLVFYKNRAPNGIKTGWIMHEFRLENPHVPPKEDWVLCRVFHKSRSENSNKLMSPHNISNNDQHHHVMPSCGHQNIMMTSFYHDSPSHQHHEGQNPSTSLGLSPLEPPGPTQLSHNINDPPPPHNHHHHLPSLSNYSNYQNKVTDQTTKCEDDYGFLFDFDGSNNIGVDMGFDDDNGSVFI
ncbi:protein cup-shaped cotyledon 3 [Phtheirospermum japonicum]|uniref:Protein cup-shaped cotyledon 3 n=1 Tax=Phtheirospermum japonicum TaxID=374723 RepID=A0A830B5N1_9LAMI|nr:protein cup-shaped cotyledon 3 [Phtheirospermum japonicum]